MRFTVPTTTYQHACQVVSAVNRIDDRKTVEANISIGAVGVWIDDGSADKIPVVQKVLMEHQTSLEAGVSAAMEEVLLRDPANWERLAERTGNGAAILQEWLN